MEFSGWVRQVSFGLIVGCAVFSVTGCLTRTAKPPLPYVKPAQSVPDRDTARLHLAGRLEEIDRELQRLSAIVEELQAQRSATRAIAGLEERVSFIEKQLGIESPPEPLNGIPPAQSEAAPPRHYPAPSEPLQQPGETVPPAPPGDQQVEIRNKPLPTDEMAYRQAYQVVRSGSSAEALPLLRQFVENYPKSKYVSDALYWIGDALYAEGEYDEAVLQFDRVIKEHPGSKKELSALLKQGEAFAKMGDPQSARIIFDKLIKEHPHSAQARQAKRLLSNLKE